MTKKLKNKIVDLLALDVRKTGSTKKLAEALTKTKWLRKFEAESLTVEILEKCFMKVTSKFPAHIGYIQKAGDESWAVMLKRTDDGKWITTVYAISLFEALAKSLIALYAHFEKGIEFHD